MTVILINEKNTYCIGVAKDYQAAVRHLINTHYIDDYTEVWCDRTSEWVPLKDAQGEEWANDMLFKWDIDTFNDFWDGDIELVTTEVFE